MLQPQRPGPYCDGDITAKDARLLCVWCHGEAEDACMEQALELPMLVLTAPVT
jgi:hypothetical protein